TVPHIVDGNPRQQVNVTPTIRIPHPAALPTHKRQWKPPKGRQIIPLIYRIPLCIRPFPHILFYREKIKLPKSSDRISRTSITASRHHQLNNSQPPPPHTITLSNILFCRVPRTDIHPAPQPFELLRLRPVENALLLSSRRYSR